jgi:predicted amidohydrolase YtcJ
MGQKQAICLDDALKAVTINAAWQLFMEDKIGSLEVGKYADFTILAQNPYHVMPEKLRDIAVLATYKSGVRTRSSTCFS